MVSVAVKKPVVENREKMLSMPNCTRTGLKISDRSSYRGLNPDVKCLVQIVNMYRRGYGGGAVMVWGFISASGVGDLIKKLLIKHGKSCRKASAWQ